MGAEGLTDATSKAGVTAAVCPKAAGVSIKRNKAKVRLNMTFPFKIDS
jgi:hypothetical protein